MRRLLEGHQPSRFDDPRIRLTTAEVITVPLVTATYFGGNIDKTRRFLHDYGYMPNMISKGRFNRSNSEQTYVVDSLPVAARDNIRIRRCRLYPLREPGGAFRGYISSKQRYFHGLRVHPLVVTEAGEPVEFSLAAGSDPRFLLFFCIQCL